MNIERKFYSKPGELFLPSSTGGPSLSLIQLRDFLIRQWRLISIITVCSITIGAFYLAMTPARFTAVVDMIIDTKRISWNQSELASENRTLEDPAVESEIETTKSERVALAVVERLNLIDDPEFVGAGRQLSRRFLDVFSKRKTPIVEAPATKDELTRRALASFKDNLKVTRVGRSYIEQIAFTSLDRDKAARIANAVADAYIDDQLQAKFDATRRASVWLAQRIDELRKQASDAYRAVQDYKSQHGIIIGSDGKLATDIELDQLGSALAKARSDTTQANAKYERIQRVLEQKNDARFNIPDPVVTDALSNPVITQLRQRFLDDQGKEAEWSARYGVDHQAAKNLRLEMAQIQRAIWDEIERIGESYKSELQIARTQEDSIDKRMSEVFIKSGGTRQAQVKLRELESSANTYRNIYETFLSRFTQSVQQQSFPSTEARIVTPATPPMGKSSPKIGLTLAFSGLCGLALGFAAAFAREQMNRQIHTRAQLEQLLNVSCLAVLPKVDLRKKQSGKFGVTSKDANSLVLIGEDQPFSATAEALRYIKVAIDLHPKGANLVGFVSALPGEGKTTVASSFAASVAKSGARVLLLDADLRNPSLTRSLGYSDSSGLLDMIANKQPYKDIVITDSRFGFDFMPASARIRPSNSSDILTSDDVKEFLKAVQGEYDYIIVDLPPLLPVVDVKAAAQLFDAFVLVVEWGSTSVDELTKAAGISSVVAERTLGAVLNKADEAAMRRYEGYTDRRYTYYTD